MGNWLFRLRNNRGQQRAEKSRLGLGSPSPAPGKLFRSLESESCGLILVDEVVWSKSTARKAGGRLSWGAGGEKPLLEIGKKRKSKNELPFTQIDKLPVLL